MNEDNRRGKPSRVPSSRLSRMAGMGGVVAGIASRSMLEGVKRLGRGEIPRPSDLLLTATNITKITDELARMRGAALKLGQLLSMDAGEILPRELADLMARVRSDANFMPQEQLNSVLANSWGADWKGRFETFEMWPVAAASIGQVHRAKARDGRELAVKVQYPGVARSIDSDIDNVVSLFRLSGLAPPKATLDPLVAEAKRQLHEEADYNREAANIERFVTHLGDNKNFLVPQVQHDLSDEHILAMSFVPGVPVEQTEKLDQTTRNHIVSQVLQLAIDEVFRFGFVQTDPNFANYTYDGHSGRIGLLDFGAARMFPNETVSGYRDFLRAGLEGDREKLRELAVKLGFYSAGTSAVHRNMIDAMIVHVFGALRKDEVFDFSNEWLLEKLRTTGMELTLDRGFNEIPPMEVIYLQRKAAGLYLLGRRLNAKVPLRRMFQEIVDQTG